MMKKSFLAFPILIIFAALLIVGCSCLEDKNTKVFRGTEAHKLSKAVMSQNVHQINRICKKNPYAMYIEDEQFHYTVLHFAVKMKKYKATKVLLELGMSPNIRSSESGETPLFLAAKHSADIKFFQLLIENGADAEIPINTVKDVVGFVEGRTPLMELPTMYVPEQKTNMEKAKFLIETAKVNLNAKDIDGCTAAIMALKNSDVKMAHYFIVELKADITQPYYTPDYVLLKGEEKSECLPVSILKDWWIYPLDSEEYAIKKEIIKEFERQGVDYVSVQPMDSTVEYIKKLYPDTWEEYLSKY